MKIETYRGVPFIDREEEIEFFVEWFSELPQRILFVYGPKSSGKTTVISYVVDNHLLKDEETFWVKYFNLRETLISSSENFLDAFFVEEEEGESEKGGKIGINVCPAPPRGQDIPDDVYRETLETDKKFSLRVFSIERKKIQEIEKQEKDLFEVLMEETEKQREKKISILIIDEIQKLEDLYINNKRELLKEFLNFCVSLTKEKYLSHVLILSSNTIFIERIYNDAKLKETSRFKKIDHLSKEKVQEWLCIEEGFGKGEFGLVWEYYGGNIGRILDAIKIKKKGKDLKEFLEQERWLAYTEIIDYLTEFDEEVREIFLRVARKIVKEGYYSLESISKQEKSLLQKWAEREILFYDPLELKVTGNSRIYEKGLELLLERVV